MIQEYRDTKEIEEVVIVKIQNTTANPLAFWLSIFFLIPLPLFIMVARKRDKFDLKKYGPQGPPGIKFYALFVVVLMSVRSKEKLERLMKKQEAEKELENNSNNVEEINDDTLNKDQLDTSDMNIMRNSILKPHFEIDNDEEKIIQNERFDDKRKSEGNLIKIGIFEEPEENEPIPTPEKDEYKEDVKHLKSEAPQTMISAPYTESITASEPVVDTDEISKKEKEYIDKQLKKKRRKRRRRPKSKSNFIEDNADAGEKIVGSDSTSKSKL